MKICWKVEGHNGLFKLTPPWRAEDDTNEADLVMVVSSPDKEGTCNIVNAHSGEVLLENIVTDGAEPEKVLTDAGWPVAGTANMLYDVRGIRFIYNVTIPAQ